MGHVLGLSIRQNLNEADCPSVQNRRRLRGASVPEILDFVAHRLQSSFLNAKVGAWNHHCLMASRAALLREHEMEKGAPTSAGKV